MGLLTNFMKNRFVKTVIRVILAIVWFIGLAGLPYDTNKWLEWLSWLTTTIPDVTNKWWWWGEWPWWIRLAFEALFWLITFLFLQRLPWHKMWHHIIFRWSTIWDTIRRVEVFFFGVPVEYWFCSTDEEGEANIIGEKRKTRLRTEQPTNVSLHQLWESEQDEGHIAEMQIRIPVSGYRASASMENPVGTQYPLRYKSYEESGLMSYYSFDLWQHPGLIPDEVRIKIEKRET